MRRRLRIGIVVGTAIVIVLAISIPVAAAHRRYATDRLSRGRKYTSTTTTAVPGKPATTTTTTTTTDPAPTTAPSTTTTSMPGPSTTTTVPGPTSCVGVTVAPGADLQSAFDVAGPGTTFCFEPGVYVLTGYVTPKSYDELISAVPRGAVLTGQDTYDAGVRGFSSYQHDVTVRGFVIEHFANVQYGPLMAGWKWTIENSEVAYNSQWGVGVNNGVVLRGNFIHDNGRYGFAGGPVNDLTVDGNEVSFNNTRHYDPNNDAGGSKIIGASAGSQRLSFTNNYVHDNYGNGLWCDTDCLGATYSGNRVTGNFGSGIFYEASFGPTVISGNTMSGNCTGWVGRSLWWCAEIFLNDSQDVDVSGNRITAGTNGIGASDSDRGSTPFGVLMVCGVTAHDNTIALGVGGQNGWVTNRVDPCLGTPFTIR